MAVRSVKDVGPLMRPTTEFKNEADVRRWFKRAFEAIGCEVFWVEAARGGTQGFADAIAMKDGESLFVELKVGEARGRWVEFEMDNVQRRTLRRMDKAGVGVFVFVGEKGGRKLWGAPASAIQVKPTNRKVTSVRGRCVHRIPKEELKFDGLEMEI